MRIESQAIRELRRFRGWTQADLAEAIGTDGVTVSRWERGASRPRAATAARLRRLILETGPRGGARFVTDPTARIRQIEAALRQMDELKAAMVERQP